MSNKARHRLTLAAGAIVAGAAIPIAAAGIAWAEPMEISFDGQVVIDTCGNACEAISGTDNDLAIAYGDGSYAEAIDGQGDKAIASDGSIAVAGSGNDDTASATDDSYAAAVGGNGDSATANGVGASAGAGYGGNNDTASATGSATTAQAIYGSGNSATADGEDGTLAVAAYGNNDTASATGYDSFAGAEVGNNDSATVTDGYESYASAGNYGYLGSSGPHDNYDTAIANGDGSTAEAGLGYNHDYASASDGYTADATGASHLTVIEPPTLDPAAVVDPAAVLDPAAIDPASLIP